MGMRRVQLSATIYIQEYGPKAGKLAAQNVQTLQQQGDRGAAAEWRAVANEIEKRAGMAR